uniref:Uncharacterized protein n=1 Tax=Lepeophtheirus salmonis TaxID=72036 RepID=A0A0K2TDS1_LEPSM
MAFIINIYHCKDFQCVEKCLLL